MKMNIKLFIYLKTNKTIQIKSPLKNKQSGKCTEKNNKMNNNKKKIKLNLILLIIIKQKVIAHPNYKSIMINKLILPNFNELNLMMKIPIKQLIL